MLSIFFFIFFFHFFFHFFFPFFSSAPVDHLRFNVQWTIVLWSFFLYPAIIGDNLPVRCRVKKIGQQIQSRGWPRWLRRLVKNDRTIVGACFCVSSK